MCDMPLINGVERHTMLGIGFRDIACLMLVGNLRIPQSM